MRELIWVLVATVGALAFGTAPAQAAVTCKVIPSLCPPPPHEGHGGKESVPEPATLGVLAAGAAAAALAARSRRGKK
jgi:hypothetical protein